MIVITGTARIAEENRDAFRRVAERQVTLSRAEAGNISYAWFEDQMDRAAVDFHFAQTYCHEFMAAARALAETPPVITIREVVVKEG